MSSKSTTPPEPTLLDVPPSKTLEEADDVPSASSSQPKRPASMSRSHSITASIKDQWDKHLGGEVGERPDWMSAFTLLDVLETFFDSRLDLFERQFKVHSDRIKHRAGEIVSKSSANLRALAPKSPKLRAWDPSFSPGVEVVDEASGEVRLGATRVKGTDGERRAMAERELRKFKDKVSMRLQGLSRSWESQSTLRTRDKVAFCFSVMTVLTSALMYGMAPEWIPVWYTIQAAFYIPTRVWTYKRKDWHYFLWDMCYYVNVLDLAWMWFFPSNTILFTACYLLTMGPLASAIVTWRNSLVFHSFDKVTSLFIHIYPPFTMTVILHTYSGAGLRYPGIVKMSELGWWRSILLGVGFYVVWQAAYWQFVIIGRREKIKAGIRPTSFEHLLHDKHNIIGRWLRATAPQKRESMFMFWQLIYTIVCFLPAVFLLSTSRFWSCFFLLFIFGVATFNGANYYVEVYSRRFERELEALRKEMAATPSLVSSTVSSPQPKERALSNPQTLPSSPLLAHSGSIDQGIAALAGEASPLVLAQSKSEAELEGFSLDDAADALKQTSVKVEQDDGLTMRKRASTSALKEE